MRPSDNAIILVTVPAKVVVEDRSKDFRCGVEPAGKVDAAVICVPLVAIPPVEMVSTNLNMDIGHCDESIEHGLPCAVLANAQDSCPSH